MIEPFPEKHLPVMIHFRTANFSDSRAPFVRQLVMGLRAYACNHVITVGTDCVTEGIYLQFASTRQMHGSEWLDQTCASLVAAYPRILAVVGHFGNGARLGLPLAQRLGVPLIGIFGGSDVNVEVSNPKYRDAYSRVFKYPLTQCVAVAPYLGEKLVSLGADPARTRHWLRGTSLDEFRPASKLDSNLFRVVIVGRLMEVKGHATAIKGFAKAWKSHPQLRLILLGDGELKQELMALCKRLGVTDVVEFRGQVKRADVITALVHANAQMLTSVTCNAGRTEGVPNAIVEGLACGLPSIGTRHGGIPEVVKDLENGFLVEEYDCDSIAESLSRLIAEPDLYQKFSTQAREDALTYFDSKVQIREMAAFIYQQYQFSRLTASRNQTPQNLPKPLGRNLDISQADPTGFSPNIFQKIWIIAKRFYCRVLERTILTPLRHAGALQNPEIPVRSSFSPSLVQRRLVQVNFLDRTQTTSIGACAQCHRLKSEPVWSNRICDLDRHCVDTIGKEFARECLPESRVLQASHPEFPTICMASVDAWMSHWKANLPYDEPVQALLVVTALQDKQLLPISAASAIFNRKTPSQKEIGKHFEMLLFKLGSKGFEFNLQGDTSPWLSTAKNTFQARFAPTIASNVFRLSEIKDLQHIEVWLKKPVS